LVTFYALRRITDYENIILNINTTIQSIKLQLKTIDDAGTFESDDEVGFFFKEVKQLGQQLEQLFETEVEDGNSKKSSKKIHNNPKKCQNTAPILSLTLFS
jgi:DNA-binding SARP family transcriptional activator